MNPENLERLKLLKEAIESIDFFMARESDEAARDKWLALKAHLYINAETIRDFSLEDYKLWKQINDRPRLSEQGSQEDGIR